jgi:hypothetical protein
VGTSITTAIAVGSALVALVMLASGAPKALGQRSAIERVVAVNYSAAAGRIIGFVEVAGAIGVLAGFIWPVIGLLAAAGCAALMAGAAVSHFRAGDGLVRALPAVVVGLLAAAVAVLHYVAF